MAGKTPLSMMHSGQAVPQGGGAAAPRRLLWLVIVPIAIFVVLAAGWCAMWYSAAQVADRTLAGWLQREAAARRIYSCGAQGISGFPFRFIASCAGAAATIESVQPPFEVAAQDLTFTAQVYRPTSLVGEITGPLTVAEPGRPPRFVANWSLARVSVSGVPPNPDSLALRIEHPHLDSVAGGATTTLFAADSAALDSRIVSGAANNHPVIDTVLTFASATAPTLHPLAAQPLRGTIEIVLRGFADLSPKPWPQHFRELHADGGAIEIKSFRVERSDAIVAGAGTLTVNEHGKLDGVVHIAVSGIETIVPLLGLDQLIGRSLDRLTGSGSQPDQGLSALDRLMPGLSGVVRQGANASLIDTIKKMGQPTTIDDKPAIDLPLRFSDGTAYLGMIRIGEVPALF